MWIDYSVHLYWLKNLFPLFKGACFLTNNFHEIVAATSKYTQYCWTRNWVFLDLDKSLEMVNWWFSHTSVLLLLLLSLLDTVLAWSSSSFDQTFHEWVIKPSYFTATYWYYFILIYNIRFSKMIQACAHKYWTHAGMPHTLTYRYST